MADDSSENQKSDQKNDWKEFFKTGRIGAGYFLTQKGRLSLSPEGYIKYRAVKREESDRLLHEWDRWILDLQNHDHEYLRSAGDKAPPMYKDHLDAYYRERVVAESEISSLENSSTMIGDSEKELISLSQKRRAKRNAQDGSEDRNSLDRFKSSTMPLTEL
ncbi:hypothetical protein BGX20_004425 [Mortierella sp. AD010]|nr:hypothetical protein BGX20_004425 [Mortierella sp. AD010]